MAKNSKHGGDGPRKPGRPPGGPGGSFRGAPDRPPRRGPSEPRADRFAGERPPAAPPGRWSRQAPGPERPFRSRPALGGDAPRLRAKRRLPTTPEPSAFAGERIAKVMARAGLCSRREAEEWITAGRITVNGMVLESPAKNVEAGDRILVDGQPLGPRERTRLFLFHKQRGLVSTSDDPEGRPTIFDALPEELPRLISVGRLDINTEGLLLLTNDGGLARVLELPSTGWLRRYRVRANGETDQAKLDALSLGVTIDGVDYAGIEAKLDRQQGANVWLTMGLREGKNREIKRVCESLGLEVNRLIRVSFGPFQLGELAEGAVEEVRTRVLRDQLGETLAREAGVDLVSPASDETRHARDERPRHDEDRPRHEERPRRPRDRLPEPTPVVRPHPGRPPTGARKHVGVIRRERAEQVGEGPRARIERSGTSDRKGRAVAVERVVSTEKAGEGRNARRFRRERRFADPVPEDEKPNRRYPPRRDFDKGAQGINGPRSRRDEAPAGRPDDDKRRRGPGRAAPAGRQDGPRFGRSAERAPGSRPPREGAPWSGAKSRGPGERSGPRPDRKGGPRPDRKGGPRPPGKGGPRPPR